MEKTLIYCFTVGICGVTSYALTRQIRAARNYKRELKRAEERAKPVQG